jgi:hypothetical protein
MKWLVRHCRESDNFSWCVVALGTLGAVMIGFYGR